MFFWKLKGARVCRMNAMHNDIWNIWNKVLVITYSSIYANKNMKLQKRNLVIDCWLRFV